MQGSLGSGLERVAVRPDPLRAGGHGHCARALAVDQLGGDHRPDMDGERSQQQGAGHAHHARTYVLNKDEIKMVP